MLKFCEEEFQDEIDRSRHQNAQHSSEEDDLNYGVNESQEQDRYSDESDQYHDTIDRSHLDVDRNSNINEYREDYISSDEDEYDRDEKERSRHHEDDYSGGSEE